jgi:hypothetical protein
MCPPLRPPVGVEPIDRWTVAGVTCAALVVAFSYWRLFFGVDLTDEAYYVEVPYRFVLGARPFIDETTPSQQGAALLMYPIFAAYHAILGAAGVILFARQLHFLFACGVAACVFVGVRPYVRNATIALLAALVPVAFVPLGLPVVSYNTLGAGFFAAGCFVGLRFLVTDRRLFAAASGFLHGLAIFAYPPLVAGVLAYGLSLVTVVSVPRRRFAIGYALAALFPLCILGGIVVDAGIQHYRDIASHAQEFGNQGGGISKAWAVGRGLLGTNGILPAFLAALAVALAWRWRRLGLVLLSLAPLLFVQISQVGDVVGSLIYVTNYSLFGVFLFVLLRRDGSMRNLFIAIWPASFVGGFAVAWSSNNGLAGFALGSMPGAIVTTIFLVVLIARAQQNQERPQLDVLAAMMPLVVLVVLQFTSVYRDDRFGLLDSRVTSGPYAGIYTTPKRRRFVETMAADLKRRSPSSCRILFYDNFPAGYLLSASKAYTNAVYLLDVDASKLRAYRRVLFDYYASKHALPDVVVRLTHTPSSGAGAHYNSADPLDRLVLRSPRYRLAFTRPQYIISYRRGAACLASRGLAD